MSESTTPPHAADELSVGTWVTVGTGSSQRRAVITTPQWRWSKGEYPVHFIDGRPEEEAHAIVSGDNLTALPLPTITGVSDLDSALLPDYLMRKYEMRWRRGLYTPAHGLRAATIAFEYALRSGYGRVVGGPDSILSPRYADWIIEESEAGLQAEIPQACVPEDFDAYGTARVIRDKLFFIGFGYRAIYRNLRFTGADWWTIEKATWGVDCRE